MTGPIEHDLKIWPDNFADLISGAKRYEIRKADRGFKPDDVVWFREYDPLRKIYTGQECFARIVYLTPAGTWGLPTDLCVFGVEVIG